MDEFSSEQSRVRPITIEALLGALRRRWWLIGLCTVVAGGAAYFKAHSEQRVYTASSSVLFQPDNLTASVLGVYANNTSSDPTRQAATNLSLLGLTPVLQRAAGVLHMSQSDLAGEISFTPNENSDLVLVNATDANPQRAAYIANTYARVFITDQRNANSQLILNAQRSITNQINTAGANYPQSQLDDLRRQANQLQVIASLQTGGVQLAATAEAPGSPSAPRPKRTAVIGILAGLLLGLGLAALLERLDNRARTTADFTDRIERPLLGTLPPIPRRRDPLNDTNVQEAIELLRVNLAYVGLKTTVKVIAVTSAIPDEGKSTVSASLSNALAHAGSSVLLIEADLRRGELVKRLGPTISYRLADVLARGIEAEEAIVSTDTWEAAGGALERPGGRLSFLPGGGPVPNPSDLVESRAMVDLLEWARANYDIVVLDTPPALAVPETLSVLPHVDGTIIVGRLGSSRRNRIAALAAQLRTINLRPLGLVIFATSRSDGVYGYEYGSTYSTGNAVKKPVWNTVSAAASMDPHPDSSLRSA